jgi:hypothetical protein
MDWRSWVQTILNGAISGGLALGIAWGGGLTWRQAIGTACVTVVSNLAGLFQRRPQGGTE